MDFKNHSLHLIQLPERLMSTFQFNILISLAGESMLRTHPVLVQDTDVYVGILHVSVGGTRWGGWC